jgi:hypothetical protein
MAYDGLLLMVRNKTNFPRRKFYELHEDNVHLLNFHYGIQEIFGCKMENSLLI